MFGMKVSFGNARKEGTKRGEESRLCQKGKRTLQYTVLPRII